MVKRSFVWMTILICLMIEASLLAKEDLIFTIDILRHGDRTPMVNLPKVSYKWPAGLGQLTEKGRQQHLQLGHFVRQELIEKQKFLPSQYEEGSLYVRATDFDRTKMSAKAFLEGLYPQNTIKIDVVPLEKDELLFPKTKSNPWSWVTWHYFAWKTWRDIEKNHSQKIEKFRQITGANLSDMREMIEFGDYIHIANLYKIPLPFQLTSEENQLIEELWKKLMVTAMTRSEFYEIMGQRLIKEMISYFEKATESKTSSLKSVFYFAHDATIMALMSYLGMPVKEIPPYASRLHFSLVRQSTHYYVTANLNGTTLSIPRCGVTFCPLKDFASL